MPPPSGRFLRDNAFLVAAVSLPVLVVAFFLLSTAVPRWLVPPPAYDLLLRSGRPYEPAGPRIAVDFYVRDGRVEAVVRPVPANAYSQLPALWLFDHTSMRVRQIPLDLPVNLAEGDPPATVIVKALAGRRVSAETHAPDGYQLKTRSYGGSGLVGDLFGMHPYDQSVALVHKGRVVPLVMPPPYEYQTAVYSVGWLVDERAR
jgi:hypothetical protein